MPLLLVLLLVLTVVKLTVSQNNAGSPCPAVCQPCMPTIVSCTRGGLSTVPRQLHQDTKTITLIGHQFRSSYLSRSNFSDFSKPRYNIQKLSIRQSNIRRLQSRTFFDLSGLDSLDFSDNAELRIENGALENVKLKSLLLDSIPQLHLTSRSFTGAQVASLSITHGKLTELPQDVLTPIAPDLRKLFLHNNRLHHLSPRLERLFRQLTQLEIHSNPLLCACPLLWLPRTLHWRTTNLQNSAAVSFTVESRNQPTCADPEYLRGRQLTSLSEKDFACTAPRLDRIEVRFRAPRSAVLVCAASITPKSAPLAINWLRVSQLKHQQPRLRLNSAHSGASPNEAAVTVQQKKDIDRFKCVAHSIAGNTSVKVNINWPDHSAPYLPELLPASSSSISGGSRNNNNNWRPKLYEENIFFREQYTLLELLGSVLGTFIVTMLLFIVIYKFYFYRTVRLKKEQLKKCGYATYEVALYSDSQTYDVPQYTAPLHTSSATATEPKPAKILTPHLFSPVPTKNFYMDGGRSVAPLSNSSALSQFSSHNLKI